MHSFKYALILVAVIVLATGTTMAHHSAVVFDENASVQKTGEVTQFIYRNPHMIITMDVDNEGKTEEWKIEGQSIAAMRQHGFDRSSLKVGDVITVKMHPLKTGRAGGLIQGMIGADGKSYSMDGSEYPAPTRQVYPALMPWEPPPAGETWQMREKKTRPSVLPIVSDGTAAGDGSATGVTAGALDPDNLSKKRPPAPFDMTGVWQYRGEDEWRANYGSFEFKPGPEELTAKGKAFHDAYMEASKKGERFGDPTAQCYPAGMPRLMTRYGSMMMIQFPTAIYMVSRLNNEYRTIFLDGRERVPSEKLDRNWGGESLGHWDGSTLVVETTGFTDENHLIQAGYVTGSQLRIVERMQMINDGNTLVTEFTFTDPEHWVGEWKHVKFRDRVLRSDIREANCIYKDNLSLPGMGN